MNDPKLPPMGEALVSLRDRISLDPTGSIRVVFEINEIDGSMEPMFECVACADIMQWRLSPLWWQCPSCSYELTASEAKLIVSKSQKQLRDLSGEIDRRGGLSWGLLEWVRRLFRPKAALNS